MDISATDKPGRTLVQTIRDTLHEEILSGLLPAGTQLRQETLAQRFETSRIPVREALRLLEAEGLVNSRPNKGAVVAAMSTAELCELLDIRMALECFAARLAVPNMVEADFLRLEGILQRYDAADSPQQWAEYNRQFHLALCEPSNNQRLQAMIQEYCLSTTNRFSHLHMSLSTDKHTVQHDHYAILAACRARDGLQVAAMLEEHIAQTRRELMASGRMGQGKAWAD